MKILKEWLKVRDRTIVGLKEKMFTQDCINKQFLNKDHYKDNR